MRKTALSLSLLFALLASCMVGCGDVKSKKVDGKEVLFKVGETNIFVEDILGFDSTENVYDFLSTTEGAEAVYEAVYKALAQKNVEITSAIDAAVEERLEDWDDEVASYASTNGVTTRNAEKAKLETLGFETREELEASYYLDEQKEELASKFKSDHIEPSLTAADGSTLLEQYVKETSPMIVKHVLVKISDSNGLHSKAAITSTEVDKLTVVMQRLGLGEASRNTFKNVAIEESDDSTSTYGGNLGIMDTYTSFVQEFKLGLYVSELVQNKDNASYDANNTFGANDFEEELFGADGIYPNHTVESINLAVVGSVLAYVHEDEAIDEQKANGHNKKAEYDAQLYPRNIIFNKYFNYPGIKYIKLDLPESTSADLTAVKAEIKALLQEVYPHATSATLDAKTNEVVSSDFFQQLLSADQKVNSDKIVVDGAGNPIVIAKSQYGFHFLSITWSALDYEAATGSVPSNAVKYFMYGKNASSLSGTYVKDSEFNFGYSTTTVGQNTRKSEIEGRVTNFAKGGFESISPEDSLYEYEIFNYYLGISEIDIPNEKLEKAVTDYIDLQVSYKAAKIDEAQHNSWEGYIESIKANQEIRDLLY